jgi:hypothetical protein
MGKLVGAPSEVDELNNALRQSYGGGGSIKERCAKMLHTISCKHGTKSIGE